RAASARRRRRRAAARRAASRRSCAAVARANSFAGAHPVADSAHRANEARVAELLAQVADVDVDDVVVAEPAWSPDALEQLPAAEHQPRLLGERLEQVELELRQLDR